MNQTESLNLLKRPVFLASLPVPQFESLPKQYSFNELARLDRLLDAYPALIAAQTEISLVASLQHCESLAADRYNQLRQQLAR